MNRCNFRFILTILGYLYLTAVADAKEIPFDKSVEVSMQYLKTDLNGNLISKGSIVKAIADQIVNSSKIEFQNNLLSAKADFFMCGGIRMRTKNDQLLLDYYRGSTTYHCNFNFNIDDDKPHKYTCTMQKVIIPVEFTDNGDYYKVKIKSPSMIDYQEDTKFFIPIDPLMPHSKLIEDVNTKIGALKIVPITAYYNFKGEVVSEYNVNSIFGNFERNTYFLKSSKKNKDGGSIEFDFNSAQASSHITIYPYRNGSKLLYTGYIKYLITDKISISKEDVENVKKNIEAVAKE